jgi:hypothetical protein
MAADAAVRALVVRGRGGRRAGEPPLVTRSDSRLAEAASKKPRPKHPTSGLAPASRSLPLSLGRSMTHGTSLGLLARDSRSVGVLGGRRDRTRTTPLPLHACPATRVHRVLMARSRLRHGSTGSVAAITGAVQQPEGRQRQWRRLREQPFGRAERTVDARQRGDGRPRIGVSTHGPSVCDPRSAADDVWALAARHRRREAHSRPSVTVSASSSPRDVRIEALIPVRAPLSPSRAQG